MIFVTGGTGLVGSRLLPRLVERGVDVRCLVHASRPVVEERSGVELVDGDFDDPGSYAAAMDGCATLFLLTPPHPDQVAREVALIDAARTAGVHHVVAVSVVGADPGSPVTFARWHGEIDDHLVGSGLGRTILRPAGFMQIHLNPPTAETEGRWYGTTGDGAHAFVDADDVAAVAAEVLTAADRDSAVHELTGPAAISMPEAAARLGRSLGREVAYVDLPPDQLRGAMLSNGVPDFVVDGIIGLYGAIRAGHAATTSHAVEQLLGRAPHRYEDVLRREGAGPDAGAASR